MNRILAYGDSNTWGFNTETKERYDEATRWTGILQSKCMDALVIEEGLNGRTTIFDDPTRPGRNGLKTLPGILESHLPVHAAIIMLGTNDCKTSYKATAETIGKGMEQCIDLLETSVPPERILLISPVMIGENVHEIRKDPKFDTRSVNVCRELISVYHDIALKRGCGFLAASELAEPSVIDDVHLDKEGHEKIGEAVYKKLVEMNILKQ